VESLLSQGNNIKRLNELTELLTAIADSYRQHFPTIRSIVLFGGITLGEFHPHFSDIDMAVVFDGKNCLPPKRLPEEIQSDVSGIPLLRETCVSPKHVERSTLEVMRFHNWQNWASETADKQKSGITETSYPFTLCDTWLLHHYGITISGEDLIGEFPFQYAPSTTPDIELLQVKWFADNIALDRPFSMGECEELLGEVIYYATTFTRAIYTLRTGLVIGRVAGTHWYAEVFPGATARFARQLGELRCADPHESMLPDHSPELLWELFLHYAQEALAYAGIGGTIPESVLLPAAFTDWLTKAGADWH